MILSDRAARWVRAAVERYLGRYYEGPDAPERLGEMVLAFANLHPKASRADWVCFAARHAAECYRAGWLRGVEHIERAGDMPAVVAASEQIADALNPDWRWSPGLTLEGSPRDVPQGDEAPLLAALALEMAEDAMTR